MPVLYTGILAIAFYLGAFSLQVRATLGSAMGHPLASPGKIPSATTALSILLTSAALLAHFATSWGQLVSGNGLDLSLIPVSVAIFFVVNLIVVASGLRQQLQSLFLLLFPATVAIIAISLLPGDRPATLRTLSPGLGAHVLLSIIAYSLMTIAALEALFLAYQNRQLHEHHASGILRLLPPLQTMERLLFDLVAIGFILLTLALITGFAFIENFMAQHLAHKTVFSLLAWAVYATLLWGRFRLGWRGRTATFWTLGGFVALMLAFWGTKFVLEVVLPGAGTPLT